MSTFNEEQEIKNDQAYLDGFNTGYDIQKNAHDAASEKDREMYQKLADTISKAEGKSDKALGLKDGKKECELEQQHKRILNKSKDHSKDRGGYSL